MARRTQAQLAETRQALLAAARQLFAEKGYNQTQVAEIALAAGTGISAFYSQFKDKEELFLLIVNEMFNDLHAGVLSVRRGMDMGSPAQAVAILARIHDLVFAKLWKHREITLSAFRSGFAAIPALEQQYWAICDAVVDAMAQDIAKGEAAGLIHLERPRDMADAILGMIQHLAHRMVRESSPTPREASRICTRMVLGGLLTSLPPDAAQRALPFLAALTQPVAQDPQNPRES